MSGRERDWRWRMCWRKVPHQKKRDAEAIAEMLPNGRACHCRLCGFWHVSTKPARTFESEWIFGPIPSA